MRGLIGHPLGHSYSKLIHELFINREYNLYDVERDELDKILTDRIFDAFNVTIPYKETVIKYMDEITESAKSIGAVNCIKNRNGKIIGHNSDYDGFLWLLKNNEINLDNYRVAVLGSGGSSKAVLKAIDNFKTKKVLKVSRNKKAGFITYDELYKEPVDCIINTTPVGMFPNIDGAAIDVSKVKDLKVAVDIIYNPFRSKLVVDALDLGIKAVGGLDMLVAQAKSAIEFFDDIEINDQEVIRVIQKIKNTKQNIVLIGMPGSGKTTISRILSEELKMNLIEIDEMIEKEEGMSISEIFKEFGETRFRILETQTIKTVQNETGSIISCGGGIIKNSENIKYLRKNGLIVFLNRAVDNLQLSDNRPLSKSKDDLIKLFNERYDLYKKYSDMVIENNVTIDEAIKEIKRKVNL